ncbi:L-seryl-tRNA(Sec) selenium transferase [Tumebacillus permanentifrigoris]|uniref:L-seryl-tRNA(Sec) selenium transferase n=1 Tax=Tumebacillus permanentifrigoris TaxID=378543 RepID=A0A316D5N4_9BACL|nr:L-seryl-tRNA(Sec) selenium transferase [Tumebacillus permanentifrigoris]PWK09053.1 L-seryl-tRNA(Sec) selenium transferase [Tumebacillus permanentifrigoris]
MGMDLLRRLPAVHRLLDHPVCRELIEQYSHRFVSRMAGEVIGDLRTAIVAGAGCEADLQPEVLAGQVAQRVQAQFQPHYRPVINATGVVLHTNLGRAPLPDVAVRAIDRTARGYTNLELNLATGERGSRYDHVERLICELTGAEAALVVNNNAAAVLLVLSEMAKGKSVVISRGQLVEIGGSFRVSEVMRASGAHLVEVGTTNKTHGYDYERAIDDETGLILKVHTSNFRVVGFTHQPELADLVALAHARNVPVYEDLGSGSLIDLRSYGIGDEPTVGESVRAGVDIVSFSGDKLLGAAQAGIIVGKQEYVKRLKKNQLTRALRVDKFTLAALEATLMLYRDEDIAKRDVPTIWMLLRTPTTMNTDAQRLHQGLADVFGERADVRLEAGLSQVGGGSLPTEELPTWHVTVKSRHFSLNELEHQLRHVDMPVMTTLQKEALHFDVRTIFPREIETVVTSVGQAVQRLG